MVFGWGGAGAKSFPERFALPIGHSGRFGLGYPSDPFPLQSGMAARIAELSDQMVLLAPECLLAGTVVFLLLMRLIPGLERWHRQSAGAFLCGSFPRCFPRLPQTDRLSSCQYRATRCSQLQRTVAVVVHSK